MAELYVTIEQAAILEETTYDTLNKRVQRNNYKIKTEENESGGKARILIDVASLSPKAKKKYRTLTKINIIDEVGITVEEQEDKTTPWYINTDVLWYQSKYKENYYKAIELKKELQGFINYTSAERTEYASEYAEKLGISQRTLYRYEQALREASAWAYKLEQTDHCNYEYFQVLALCRKPKEKGTFPSMSMEVKTTIENIWFNERFAKNRPTYEMLYTALIKVTNENGWKCPSYQTVARYINYLMVDMREANAHFLLAHGQKEWRNKVMHKAARNMAAIPVMGMVQGDEHTFDCWVSYKNPNGKISAVKPVLVAWIDMRSRAVFGDIMCVKANSQILKQSLVKMMYSEIGGVPECILIDNGKDYTGKEMTGRNRKQRRSEEQDSALKMDAEMQGFYHSIGIEDDFRALPYSGWVKGQIERFFGTVCNQFTKWFDSYTGTLTGSKTIGKVKKDVKRLLERGELYSMEEFFQLWTEWKEDHYMKHIHRGLKEQKEEYKTPLECFLHAENRYFKAAPPKSYAAMLLMKSDEVYVSQQGIRRFGNIYYAPELCDFQKQKVSIRYDPEDVTRLYVYDKEGVKICEAESQELLLVAPRMPQKALEDHMKEQNRQLRSERDKITNRQKTIEERAQEYDSATSTAGTLELTKGKKPIMKKSNVVSLPIDRQYAEELKEQKREKDNYFINHADKAMEQLRQLG